MKFTPAKVKQFERDQKDSGTKTALLNIQWQIASDLMKEIGVVRTQTTYAQEAKSKR